MINNLHVCIIFYLAINDFRKPLTRDQETNTELATEIQSEQTDRTDSQDPPLSVQQRTQIPRPVISQPDSKGKSKTLYI